MNYLGYPGTWGANFIDYFIGDKVTVSENNINYFSEKIIFLPHVFQVNQSHRPIADNGFKQSYGLPKEAFVYCCFNNSWKITPEVMEQWAQILKQTPNGVLWLSDAHPAATKNLKQYAEISGIDPSRLFFAERLPSLADHLARYQVADLFLDTFPYGAHTTASDALWAKLPVLTRAGESFASRVGASLLFSIGLPELITYTPAEYQDKAIELATDHKKMSFINAKLESNHGATPLFNTPLFARNIESAYQTAYDRYHAGLAPDHIYVET